jgi:tRNA threonylcarbamoyladenosine biosynthesis protein TsaB
MNVLALDTSTSCMSVALLKDDVIACEVKLVVKLGHGGMLLSIIDEVLRKSDTPRESIGLIAVGSGPGSFTGLRIGIATAKGLAMALHCPLAGISTLDAMARGVSPSSMQIMPVMDARKHEVFCALYDNEGIRLSGHMNLKPEEIPSLVSRDTVFVGNALPLYRDIFGKSLGTLFHEGPTNLWNPSASVIGIMALELPMESLPEDVLPSYVRASDATLLLEKRGTGFKA